MQEVTSAKLRSKLYYEQRKKSKAFRQRQAYRSRVWYYKQKGIDEANIPLQIKGKYAEANNKKYIIGKNKSIVEPPKKIEKITENKNVAIKTNPATLPATINYDIIEACHNYLRGRFVSRRKIDFVFNLLKALIK